MRTFLAISRVVVLALLAACGKDRPEPGSLLAREMDAVFEEVGALEPDREHGWGDEGEGAWYADTHDGLVWTRGSRASLVLRSLAPADRTLEVVAAAPVGGATHLTVALGGQTLATVELEREPRRFEIAAPAAVWSAGDNLLELSVDRTAVADAPSSYRAARRRQVGVGVGEVGWAEPRRVERTPDGLVLADGTGVLFHLAGPLGGGIELRGRTARDGALTIALGELDTRTGVAAFSAANDLVLPEDGRVVRDIAFDPTRTDATRTVRLEWRGDAALVLERLVATAVPADRGPATGAADALPNVVLVSIDTLAARHLSCYGYPRATTPNIDAFARESVLFTDCIANAPWTAPSYLSQLSGLYPNAHYVDAPGVRDPQGWETNHLAESRWTLTEALRAGGYATAAWIDNPWVSAAMGMAQGFDLFDTSASKIWLSEPDGGFAHIAPRARAWMGEQQQPFFAFLQPMDPHGPYYTRWRYRDRWDGDGLYDPNETRPVGRDQLHVFGVIPQYVAEGERAVARPLPDRLRTEPYANAYDEKIAEVDDIFGDLMQRLERAGLYENTIIVLSSDHGEAVGEHEWWFDHGTLYDEVLRVPLIVRLPGGEHGGRRVDTGVQLVDLMPTLLELTGQPVPEWGHGRSLVPALRGVSMPQVPRFALDGIVRQETVIDGADKLVWSQPAIASLQTKLRHPRLPAGHVEKVAPELAGTWWTSGAYAAWLAERPQVEQRLFEPLAGVFRELYRLDDDPLELNDLVRDGPTAAAGALAERLEALRLAERARGESARSAARRTLRTPALGGDVRAQLEALGYLEPAAGVDSGGEAGGER